MKTNVHLCSYFAQFFLELEIFQTKAAEKIKTRTSMFHNFFFKSRLLWDSMEKYYTAGQITDDNMSNAHFMLDTKGYKHTHTHTKNMWYLLLFNYNNGCPNAPQCYFIRIVHCLYCYFTVVLPTVCLCLELFVLNLTFFIFMFRMLLFTCLFVPKCNHSLHHMLRFRPVF